MAYNQQDALFSQQDALNMMTFIAISALLMCSQLDKVYHCFRAVLTNQKSYKRSYEKQNTAIGIFIDSVSSLKNEQRCEIDVTKLLRNFIV